MTRNAFTLIETIVVVAITALIFVTLGSLLTYFYKTNAYTLQQATAVAQARQGVEDAMRYLREASYGSDGSYPIASVATSSITFYANVNNDFVIERVTYILINGTLYRVVAEPSGNPPSYVGATIATSTIATSVINASSTPMFSYFDNTGALLSTPINISKISSIKTVVVVDVNVNRAPVAFTLSGGATLRNLRNQL
ncbi:MAG: type II secretion system protein [Minisyncoccia bacterium]|jgi:type II secretory pathway pseudopilin PulG